MLIVERYTPMTALSLLLLLLLHPLISECSDASSPSDKPLFYTRPKIISNHNNGEELKIGLNLNSTNIIVVLHKNRELSHTYKVYTQDDDGNLIPNRKAPPCQYIGHVLGNEPSLAIISTCDGIRGKVQYGKVEYRIRPVKDSSDNYYRHGNLDYGTNVGEQERVREEKMSQLHELYDPPVHPGEFTFGHTNPEDGYTKKEKKSRQKRLTGHGLTKKEIMKINVKKLERRFLELSIVVDREQHILIGKNTQKTTDFVEEVVNNIASKYKPFNIIVGLVQFVIWDKRDVISMPDNYTKILDSLSEYRKDVLLKKRWSDITTMITGEQFFERQTIGGAYTDQLCHEMRSSNINFDTAKTKDLPYLATLISHEIGHVMGMYHDTDRMNQNRHGTCDCPCLKGDFKYQSNYKVPDFCGEDDRCIMSPTVNRNYEYFSLCSRHILEGQITQHRCLFNAPKVLVGAPTCGNAVIEDGETCDCGSEEDCPILDPCCEVGTCQLKNTSSCFTGSCCSEECQFKDKGTVCREKTPGMECDFEESCSGADSGCQRDTYVQDGRKCTDGNNKEGFCSSSDCMTHLTQCRHMFGSSAWVGEDGCWKANKQGYWQGNCGYTINPGVGVNGTSTTTYIKCEEKNFQCGLLQCMVRTGDVEKAKAHAGEVFGTGTRVVVGAYSPKGQDDSYPRRCVIARFHPPAEDATFGEDDENVLFVDPGQVKDYTSCGADLGMFCKSKECMYEEPTKCPAYEGEECAGHGQCNNLNQCHCDKDWDSDLCVNFNKDGGADYMTIIIILCVAVVLVPLIVGIIVYIVKHKFDLKTMAADRDRITRGIRRFSSRAFSRQGSTRSDGSSLGLGNVKMPTIRKYASKAIQPLEPLISDTVIGNPVTESHNHVAESHDDHVAESHDNHVFSNHVTPLSATCSAPGGATRSRMSSFFTGIRVPKISDMKRTMTSKPIANTKKTALRVPPAPPKTNSPNVPKRPAAPPKPTLSLSPFSSANSTPNSSTTKLDRLTTGGGPPPVPPPPAPPGKSSGAPLLRNVRDGLRPARLDARTHSDTFKNGTSIPMNNLARGEKPLSDSNLTKKPLQPPKLLAGRSRESKKLQISGPTNESLFGLDGRPKSVHLATDIKQSSDSINTVSSTRALFDPNIKKKPPSAGSRWK